MYVVTVALLGDGKKAGEFVHKLGGTEALYELYQNSFSQTIDGVIFKISRPVGVERSLTNLENAIQKVDCVIVFNPDTFLTQNLKQINPDNCHLFDATSSAQDFLSATLKKTQPKSVNLDLVRDTNSKTSLLLEFVRHADFYVPLEIWRIISTLFIEVQFETSLRSFMFFQSPLNNRETLKMLSQNKELAESNALSRQSP